MSASCGHALRTDVPLESHHATHTHTHSRSLCGSPRGNVLHSRTTEDMVYNVLSSAITCLHAIYNGYIPISVTYLLTHHPTRSMGASPSIEGKNDIPCDASMPACQRQYPLPITAIAHASHIQLAKQHGQLPFNTLASVRKLGNVSAFGTPGWHAWHTCGTPPLLQHTPLQINMDPKTTGL